jgi:hypothetical protein
VPSDPCALALDADAQVASTLARVSLEGVWAFPESYQVGVTASAVTAAA